MAFGMYYENHQVSFFGFSHWANSHHSCIYYWQKFVNQQLIATKAQEPWRYKKPLNGNLFAKSILAKPTQRPYRRLNGTGKLDLFFWHTNYAWAFWHVAWMCCMVEKIIHLQISYVWVIKDEGYYLLNALMVSNRIKDCSHGTSILKRRPLC